MWLTLFKIGDRLHVTRRIKAKVLSIPCYVPSASPEALSWTLSFWQEHLHIRSPLPEELFTFTFNLVYTLATSRSSAKGLLPQFLLTCSDYFYSTGSWLGFTFLYMTLWSMSAFPLECEGPDVRAGFLYHLLLDLSWGPPGCMAWGHGLENKWSTWALLIQGKMRLEKVRWHSRVHPRIY